MISIPELKAALRLTTDADNGYLADLEAAAVDVVQNETNRYFGPVGPATEYLEGGGTRDLFLSEPPASLPATVSERAYPAGTATTITAADSDGYVLRGTMKLVRKAGLVWTFGYEYEVTYSRGYADSSEPADIRQAVTQLVSHWYEHRLPVGKVGDVVPLGAQKVIARWRRRPWA